MMIFMLLHNGGDRLDTIAQKYYNDSTLWWIIAIANKVHNWHLRM